MRHARLSYKAMFSMLQLKVYVLVMVLSPLSQLLFFSMLVRYIYQGEGLSGYIAANALLLCVMNSVFGMMTVIMSDRGMGTLPLVIVTPANKGLLFLARSVPHIMNGIVTACLGLLFGVLVFQITLSFSTFLLLVCIWLVSIFAACGLGLILASCSLWTPSMHLLANLLASTLLLLSGANYSLQVMPDWLRFIAQALPLTRGVELTKAIVGGGDLSQFAILLTEEFLLGCVFFMIGIVAMRYAEMIARRKGTMELS